MASASTHKSRTKSMLNAGIITQKQHDRMLAKIAAVEAAEQEQQAAQPAPPAEPAAPTEPTAPNC